MIRRYTHPEMGRVWSDQRKYETWLQVEMAAADAMAREGRARARLDDDLRRCVADAVQGLARGAAGHVDFAQPLGGHAAGCCAVSRIL